MKQTGIKRKQPSYPPRKLVKQREAWALEFAKCFVCGHQVVHNPKGFSTLAAHVHHIANRSQAPGRYEHPANWSVLCHYCHLQVVHSKGGNWWASLLAAKQNSDPKHFDLDAWREMLDYNGLKAVIVSEDEIRGAAEALRLRSFCQH